MQKIRCFFFRKIFRINPEKPEKFKKNFTNILGKKSGRAGKFFLKKISIAICPKKFLKKSPGCSTIFHKKTGPEHFRPKKITPGKIPEC